MTKIDELMALADSYASESETFDKPPRRKMLRAALEAALKPGEPEMHEAMCQALTGGKCNCPENPASVDKAWARFCGGIGRGPDAPYPGMIEAFETHYGQSFTDKDWRNETSVWAAAWKAAVAAPPAQTPDAQGRLGAGTWVNQGVFDHNICIGSPTRAVSAAPPAQTPVAPRPVTPLQCPKCHALWLHWPKEQTGQATDSLNLRSAHSCGHCESGGVACK